MEAVAVTIRITRIITICNIYTTPDETITLQQLQPLTNQLPQTFILVGDFNARYQIWGDSERNAHGRVIEQLVTSIVTFAFSTEMSRLTSIFKQQHFQI